MHQAPSGLAPELMHHVHDVIFRNLPAPIRCMFKYHMGIWTIDTAMWRNVCLHTKRTVFCVRKCDKLRS